MILFVVLSIILQTYGFRKYLTYTKMGVGVGKRNTRFLRRNLSCICEGVHSDVSNGNSCRTRFSYKGQPDVGILNGRLFLTSALFTNIDSGRFPFAVMVLDSQPQAPQLHTITGANSRNVFFIMERSHHILLLGHLSQRTMHHAQRSSSVVHLLNRLKVTYPLVLYAEVLSKQKTK